MKVKFEQDDSTKDLDFTGSVLELLEILNVNAETVLVVRNSEVLTDDIILNNEDLIELLSVVSGG
jgi:sulfur carrier protein ThiS